MSGEDTMDLFGAPTQPAVNSDAPLADRMRPRTLDEYLGQDDAIAERSFLREAVTGDHVPSMILWGPPGCGKTSLAHVIANSTSAEFEVFSAVLGGIKDVREIVARAGRRRANGVRTILFVDEIHRFNKAQQDGFLPHVERGTVTLIGATTENPSFALNAALLSRCRVVTLSALDRPALKRLLELALNDAERGVGTPGLEAGEAFLEALADMADGDARRALNLLEQTVAYARSRDHSRLELTMLREVLERAPLRYDKSGDAHYDTVSAFIKSMRGSDPDASLYYAARMIESGEEPLFLLRRILIFASEDVGNADPRALQVALAAYQAFQRLGMPEGALPMAQAITYCATAPKSNASYAGWLQAAALAKESGSAEIPMHLRNAPTGLMKKLGYGKDYQYPHDAPGHHVQETYLPEKLAGQRFYTPAGHGYEKYIVQRLARWRDEEPPEGDGQ